MKTAFMSYVIGSKSFIDMAIVTILSYIETNDTEIYYANSNYKVF